VAQGDLGPPPRAPLWRRREVRAVLYQALLLGAILGLAAYLVANTLDNLAARSIRAGFDFLGQEAGFYIGESLIRFEASDTYLRAFVAGLLNTLRVAALGIVAATVLGTLIGIARLSHNWLLSRIATAYIEGMRNVPVLLQLFLWYSLITGLLPLASEALEIVPGVFLSKSGLTYPVPEAHPIHRWLLALLAIGAGAAALYVAGARRRQERSGRRPPLLWPCGAIIAAPAAAAFVLSGAPLALEMPEWRRFRYAGGDALTPEFLALLLGLGLYTAAFIAEVVRGGIQAVPAGQSEAARSLGLRRGLVLRLIVLPQALRVILPPLTSQYLNLTKNSSLAVAIGYPDLVSIANTSLNQTGQAIECIAIIMAVYLAISLTISALMNWYNRRIALVEH